ncbi:MAG: FixH family protein [Phycisphaerales bacterium]|nr:FixH family protein [Phycisphaerales bacterium]
MTDEQPAPNKSGFFNIGKHWPYIIVGMLLFHATLMIGTIVVISARHDLFVEPDYYAKSIKWDEQKAKLETPARLGWNINLEADQSNAQNDGEDSALPTMRVTLKDQNGDSIDRALVEVVSFHPAHANNRIESVLIDNDNGVYEKQLAMIQPGFWKVNLTIRYQGAEAFVNREIEIR